MMNCSLYEIFSIRPRLTRKENKKVLANLNTRQKRIVEIMKPV